MKLLLTILAILFLLPVLFYSASALARAAKQEVLAANSRGLAKSPQVLAANAAALSIRINDNTEHLFGKFDPNAGHGIVMAANDANFDAAHLSEPLTEYIVDFPDEEGLDTLLDAAAPVVMVGRSFAYRSHDSKEAFQLALSDEDIREIGGDFPTIRLTGTQVDGRTDNKGLIMALDNDQGGEDTAVQQGAVANLRNRLLRSELYRLEVLLEANDTNNNSNWGPAATSPDPDGDIVADIDSGGDARGINSNIVLFGGGAHVKRFRSLGPKDGRSASAERGFSLPQLADFYGVNQVLKSNFRYQSSASAKAKIVADKVYSYYARPGAMPSDPSNVKRFVTAVPGGGRFRVYIIPMLKKTLVCVEHYSRIALTSSLGIYKRTVTYT
jgi:hypothetical protein